MNVDSADRSFGLQHFFFFFGCIGSLLLCIGSSLWHAGLLPCGMSCLGNPMERGAWQDTVHGVAKVGYD